MTPEERFQKIEENLLVQAELVARFERRTEVRLESAEERLDRIQGMIEAQISTVDRLVATVDRFIRAQGNGHNGE